jgi:amino acid transporter
VKAADAVGAEAIAEPAYERLRRRLLGPPLRTDQDAAERLSNPVALAILSSDALSSVAYATEEMLKVLIPAVGIAAYGLSVSIAGAIIALLALLVLSYRQTIKAYPNAGGAYVVTRDNFGVVPAQGAGAALMLDYVMTVAVSVAAATAALYSYFPGLYAARVPLGLTCISLLAWGNLRGVRATGHLFAAPTYLFLASLAALLVAGIVAALSGGLQTQSLPPDLQRAAAPVSAFVLLRAYSSGTTALTGVEAISNGVSVFRPVEWRNARRVLAWMGAILAVGFAGITLLAWRVRPVPSPRRTVVSELGRVVFGPSPAGRVGLLVLQVATTAILVLAANTSFSDFPRLASFHAADGYLPRPLRRRGQRLVFSTGILALAGLATTVVVVLGASVHRMIPLYAVGVFVSFTLSQAGMVVHHLRRREPGWRGGLAVNALGGVGSAVALAAILVSKLAQGAWVVAVLVPLCVRVFLGIRHHYDRSDAWLGHPLTGRTSWSRVTAQVAPAGHDRALEAGAHRYLARARARMTDLGTEARDPAEVRLVLAPVAAGRSEPPAWSGPGRMLRRVRRLPNGAAATLAVDPARPSAVSGEHVCLVVAQGRGHGLTRRALALARLLQPDRVHAVHVDLDAEETARAVATWPRDEFGLDLEVVPAPYRERGRPLRAEAERLYAAGAETVTLVVCTVGPRWWQRPLYAADTASIRRALASLPGTAVVDHRLPLRGEAAPAPTGSSTAVSPERSTVSRRDADSPARAFRTRGLTAGAVTGSRDRSPAHLRARARPSAAGAARASGRSS